MGVQGCCGCGLRGGSLAVGVVLLTITVLELLSNIVLWGMLASQGSLIPPLNSTSPADDPTPTDASPSLLQQEAALGMQTCSVLVALLFNTLLVHGASRSAAGPVLAWLVYYCIVFVTVTLSALGLLIGCFVMVHLASQPAAGEECATLAVVFGVAGGVCVPLSALLWYSWAVVLAFYRQLSGAAGFQYRRDVVP